MRCLKYGSDNRQILMQGVFGLLTAGCFTARRIEGTFSFSRIGIFRNSG